MPDDHDELRDFSWRRLFPWLILQRALRTSLAPQLLLLATLGCLLNPIGWNVATLLFEYDSPAMVDSSPEDVTEEGTAEETDKPQELEKLEADGDKDKASGKDFPKSADLPPDWKHSQIPFWYPMKRKLRKVTAS